MAILVGTITLFLGMSALGNLDQDRSGAFTALYVQLIVYGVFRLVQAFAAGEVAGNRRKWFLIVGMLAVLVLVPALSGVAVGVVLLWLIAGVIEVVAAVRAVPDRPGGWRSSPVRSAHRPASWPRSSPFRVRVFDR